MDEVLNALSSSCFTRPGLRLRAWGGVWRRTRRRQLATAFLTALSWFGLGLRYRWGCCPCSDWHWEVRSRLGFNDPPSHIQLLIWKLSGIVLGPLAADALALVTPGSVTFLGLMLCVCDRLRSNLE